jgi:hypothetical protein
VGKEMMVRNLLLAGANVQVQKQLLSYLETRGSTCLNKGSNCSVFRHPADHTVTRYS